MASVIKHILYFDIETKYLADEVGGWDKSAEMGISVATSYDSGTGQYYSFEESNISELIDQILNTGLVVGFNQLRFDYRVLFAYSDADFWSVPSFDMLVGARILGTRLTPPFALYKQEYIEEHRKNGQTFWCGNYRYVRVGLRRSRTLNGSQVSN